MTFRLPRHGLKTTVLCFASIGQAAAETHDVTVQNFTFTPNELAIQAGDTVRWTNVQGTHDVTDDNLEWGSVTGSGWVFERTFSDVGEVLYHCTVHSSPGQPIATNMNGRLMVSEPPPEFIFADGFESP